MGFKVVFLWTDVALWAMFAALVLYIVRLVRRPHLRATGSACCVIRRR